MDKIIAEKQSCIDLIQKARQELADLKEKRAIAKAPLWEVAEGTVDAKKDFIKSKIANTDKEIAYKEANIEYLYNRLNILDNQLVYHE
jgi:hypothetical protein